MESKADGKVAETKAAASMRRISRMNLVIGGILVIAGALTQPRDMALGIAVGVALTIANFFVLGRLVRRWTADAAKGQGGSAQYLMAPKMIVLMLAVVLALKFLPIDAAGFAIGYSIFVLSIVLEAIYSNMSPTSDGATDNHG